MFSQNLTRPLTKYTHSKQFIQIFRREKSNVIYSALNNKLNFSRLTLAADKFPKCLTESQSQDAVILRESFEKLVASSTSTKKDIPEDVVDPEFFQKLKEAGAFGATTPTEYEGLGLTNTPAAYLYEVLGKYNLGYGVILGAHQSIGYKGIQLFGTEEQKKKYLPKLASGSQLACFCLTEPGAGSDAASVKSKATYDASKKAWILNGSKIWISNGDTAEIMTVFAKTIDPVTKEEKMSAFIVERAFEGVKSGKPDQKMGIKCAHSTEISFENVVVPEKNVLGEIGTGFKSAVNILNSGRFGLGAAMVGSLNTLVSKSYEHSVTRKQFGLTLFEFQDIKVKLANMIALTYASESMLYYTSGLMDIGVKSFDIESTALKIFSSESAWYACDETIQILGGMGYMKDAGVEKIMRDLRIFRIFEGANDVLRLFIFLTGFKEIKPSDGHVLNSSKTSAILRNFQSIFKRGDVRDQLYDYHMRCLLKFALQRKINLKNQFIARHMADLQISLFALNCSQLRLAANSDSKKVAEDVILTHLKNQIYYKHFPSYPGAISRLTDSADKVCKILHENGGQYPTTHPIFLIK